MSYQRPHQSVHSSVLKDLHDYEKVHKYLGNEKYYHDFLVFFQCEIDEKGYEAVINEYCLKGDERADDMLVRLHAGFLHPMIHLGFGVEFKQPAIIAEALAQAAVHDNWIGYVLWGSILPVFCLIFISSLITSAFLLIAPIPSLVVAPCFEI